MSAWEWQLTSAAKDKGLRCAPAELPQGERESEIIFVDDLRGPAAWFLSPVQADPTNKRQLSWTDGLLVIYGVHSQCAEHRIAPEWRAGLNKLQSKSLDQLLSKTCIVSILGQRQTQDATRGDDSAEIIDFIPKHEAFVHPSCGLYLDFYRLQWKSISGPLDCENSEPWDTSCTWEPAECLDDVKSAQAFKARQNWAKRVLERTQNAEAATSPDVVLSGVRCALLQPAAGSPPSTVPDPITYPKLMRHVPESRISDAVKAFRAVAKSGELQVRDLNNNIWYPRESRTSSDVLYWASDRASIMQGQELAAVMVPPSWKALPAQSDHDISPEQLRQRSRSPRFKRSLFRPVRCVGKGSFGEVKEVIELESGVSLAVKSVGPVNKTGGQDACAEAIKEAKMLMTLRHPNVVGLRNIFWANECVHLVLELAPTTLERFMVEGRPEAAEVPRWAKQLFQALQHCHSHQIVHCDVKPPNVLVCPAISQLKLADFGSATAVGAVRTEYYFSRWYRPPEVVCGRQDAQPQQDVWSAGTIFAEMYMHEPLFAGRSMAQQLACIMSVLGTPSDEEMRAVLCLSASDRSTFPWTPRLPPMQWSDVVGAKASTDALRLISMCLMWVPARRISASEMIEKLRWAASWFWLCSPFGSGAIRAEYTVFCVCWTLNT
eukprot:TRINITY_DN3379_c1_g1_i2.p1 TRINITY_DN3379_c1_g1~~TRINITY_DN3379_c1_g1_i2.p1  ORF type:complete len:661 (-),score=95.76 TRINITY_DN3379_c1_g1_i2:7-1989(-)